jgi:hypothetical protein
MKKLLSLITLLSLISIFLVIQFPANLFSLTIGLVKYRGGDWYNNIDSVKNLLRYISERTSIKVDREPKLVSLESKEIFDCDILYISGHVPINFNETEKKNLRDYLINYKGFVFVNDDYGMDESFRKEIKKVFPEYNLEVVPFSHPIYNIFYKFPNGLPKIHEHDGGPPEGLGIFIEGELRLFYAYNTDIGDGWDSPEVHNDPENVREEAIRMGINIVMYALTRMSF